MLKDQLCHSEFHNHALRVNACKHWLQEGSHPGNAFSDAGTWKSILLAFFNDDLVPSVQIASIGQSTG